MHEPKRSSETAAPAPPDDGPSGGRLIRLAPAPLQPDAQARRPLHILAVDDLTVNRKLLSAILDCAGHTVVEADSGPAAVEAALSSRFDLILMDVHMPRMDGPSAARIIRAAAGPNVATPILALTADTRPQQIAECSEAGMNGYLTKTISLADLLGAVTNLEINDEPAPAPQA